MRFYRLASIAVLFLMVRHLWADPSQGGQAPLDRTVAAPAAPEASYDELLAAGRTITAYRRLNDLLRENPQDAELHYQAIDCAAMAGLSEEVLDHTLSFVTLQKADNDPRVKDALAALLDSRPADPSLLDRYCRLDKQAGFDRGIRQIKLAQDEIKGQLAIGCGRVLLTHYTDEHQVKAVQQAIYDCAVERVVNSHQWLEAIKDLPHAFRRADDVRRFMDAGYLGSHPDKEQTALKHADRFLTIAENMAGAGLDWTPWGSWQMEQLLGYVPESERDALVKRYLALSPSAGKLGFAALERHLSVLRHTHLFGSKTGPGGKAVSTAELQPLFEALLAMPEAKDGRARPGGLPGFLDGWLNEQQRLDFIGKCLPAVQDDQIVWWADKTEQKDREAVIAQARSVAVDQAILRRVMKLAPRDAGGAPAEAALEQIKQFNESQAEQALGIVKTALDKLATPLDPRQGDVFLRYDDLFNKHWAITRGNRDRLAETAELWAPRLGQSWRWDALTEDLFNHNRRDTMAKIWPPFKAALDKGYKRSRAVRNMSRMDVPPATESHPLLPYFDRLELRDYIELVVELRGSGKFAVQFLAAGNGTYPFEMWRTYHEREPDSWNLINDLANNISAWCERDKTARVPKPVLDVFMTFFLDFRGDANMYSRTVMMRIKTEGPGVVDPILAEVAAKPLDKRLGILLHLTDYPEVGIEVLTPHLIKAFSDPGIAAVGSPVRLDGLRGPIEAVVQNPKANRDLRDAIMGGLVKLMDGRVSVYSRNSDNHLFVLREVANQAIEQKRWRAVTRSLQAMTGAGGTDQGIAQRVIDYMKPPIDSLMALDVREPVVAALRRLQMRSGMSESQQNWVVSQMATAGRGLPGLFPVEPSHPAYDLYVAADALNAGRLEVAWAKTRPKTKLVLEHWEKLDPAYVAWCAEKMRQFQDYTEAATLCRHLLTNEQGLEAGLAAEIFLTRGDIFRDQKSFDLARLEYESLRNNRRYAETDAGRKASFRLVDLLLLTNNFGAAEPVIERMTISPDPLVQAQAYFYRARILYLQKDYNAAWDELQNCFKIKFDHTEGQLLLGELKVVLKRDFEDNRIFVTPPTDLEKLTPGRSLHLRLRDSNRVAGGGTIIPVEVVTSKGKDREVVRLLQSGADPTLFVADLPTRLGPPVPDNRYLEIFGDEMVSYQLDPQFRKQRGLPAYPVHHLEVADDARVTASAGIILTPEEQEKQAMEASLASLGDQTLRERMSTGSTVRPGSPIYIQVSDRDRNLTDQPDKVTVNLKTSSGDVVEDLDLVETGPMTGVFRGQCPTAISPPRCTASDSAPGSDPGFLINSSVAKGWASLADSKPGKWIEVDTQGAHVLKEASLETADAGNIQKVSLMGMLADEWVKLADYPDDPAAQNGGCHEYLVAGRSENDRRGQIRVFQVGGIKPELRTGPHHDRDKTPLKERDGWVVGRVQGVFHLQEDTKLEFRFLQPVSPSDWQWVYLHVDGEEILAGRVDANTIDRSRTIFLEKGVHSLEYTFRDHHKNSRIIIGVRDGAGEFVPMPDDWFSLEKNPGLAEAIKPRATLERTPSAIKATFRTQERWRKVKWVFDEYKGAALHASRITITDGDGKTLVPGPVDYSSATANRQLEVSPGDRIVVTYRDVMNMGKGDKVVEANLNASYANGTIRIVEEVMRQDEQGRVHVTLVQAYRYKAGQSLAVLVEDADLDLSADADTVEVGIRTSSGQTLKVSALEQPNAGVQSQRVHTGRFLAVVKTGPATDLGKGVLGVKDGDTVIAGYIDSENTDPGIRFARTARLLQANATQVKLQPYSSRLIQEEDASQQATGRLAIMKRRGMDIDGLKLMKDVVVVRQPEADVPVLVNAGAPFFFEVHAPAAALHAASTIRAQVCSHSEMKAAKAENREPRWAETTLVLGGFPAGAGGEVRLMSPPRTQEDWVADGIFGGRVELQVGAPGAEPQPVLAAGGPVRDKAQSPPVVVVSGADKLVLRYAPEGRDPVDVEADVVSEGRLELLDRTYSAQSPRINLGESFYLQVTDYDQDKSDQLDMVRVAIQTSGSASSAIELIETLPHSGIFTAQITPTWKGPAAAPANTNTKAEGVQSPSAPDAGAALPVDFGETVRFTYQDPTTPEGTPRDVVAEGAIYDGDNGDLSVFSKRFADPEMAVKVRFLWAEALFEQAKNFRELKNPEIAQARIMEGELILNEALRDYPDTKLKDQGAFLLANLNEELAKDEPDEKKKIGLLEKAIVQYASILTQWPDGEFAPRAQFKKALCLELLGDFDRAAPEYVRLTYTWPEHTLVADATLRLANHYYKGGLFDVAGSIFRNFSKLRPEHDLAPKTLFLAGQCYMQQALAYSETSTGTAAAKAAKQWEKASEAFQLVVDNYPDRKEIRPEAMYWAGDVCFKTRDYKNSYRNFIKLTLDYPETEWAKRARGYLTDTAFARMEE